MYVWNVYTFRMDWKDKAQGIPHDDLTWRDVTDDADLRKLDRLRDKRDKASREYREEYREMHNRAWSRIRTLRKARK